MLRSYDRLFVAIVMSCTFAGAYGETASQDNLEPDKQVAPQIAIAYPVSTLPVWRMDESQPKFDATLLIAHLKNYVGASARIVPSEENRCIVVVAAEEDHEVVRRVLSPLWAFGGDINAHLQQRIADAKTSSQKILLLAADPNSGPVKRFFDAKLCDEHLRLQDAFENYAVQCIPSDDRELLTKLGVTVPQGDDAMLAILDSEGLLVAEVAFAKLDTSSSGLVASLVEFLETHQPEFTDARIVLSSGYNQALREQKRVLLLLSGPNCGPCIELTRFLEKHGDFITKDFVWVKLDTRMPRISDVLQGMRPEQTGPVPWMAILGADGNVLATSDGPGGNIGYPRTQEARLHFQAMLRKTAQRLTADDIRAITESLGPTINVEP